MRLQQVVCILLTPNHLSSYRTLIFWDYGAWFDWNPDRCLWLCLWSSEGGLCLRQTLLETCKTQAQKTL